jgi:polysaccharide biosynthesis/export protein
MNKFNIQFLLIFSLSSIFLVSCMSKKNIVYFQGEPSNTTNTKGYDPVLKSDDLLSITVMDLDPIAVVPFNIPVTNVAQGLGGYSQGTPPPPGYLVDSQGNIDFPVVGKVHLSGMTRSAAIDTLKKALKPYLAHPTVLMRILNYQVTVLGEVRNPGTFTIPNERITLPEALGIAGDLLITGERKNVLVIREVDGKRKETRIDLTTKELFSSEVYYLNQNDVVYVQPNRAKVNSSLVNTANAGLVVSIISVLVTMVILFKQ